MNTAYLRLPLCVLAGLVCALPAAAQSTTLVSVGSGGGTADGSSNDPALSRSGRYVAYSSYAADLLPGGGPGPNGIEGIFVRDMLTGAVSCVSLAADGGPADGSSTLPSLSASGRFVAFQSEASNLVPDDLNGQVDVFVHDRATGRTVRASVSSVGAEADAECVEPALSGDGGCVAFHSYATTLVPAQGPVTRHIYLRDLRAGSTSRVSVNSSGEPGDSYSGFPALSGDGQRVVFESEAQNLVSGDTNGTHDIFLHDRTTASTIRVSVTGSGGQAASSSHLATISYDGQVVAFESFAANLVPDDSNGQEDIFVHDLRTGTNVIASHSTAGVQGNDHSSRSVLSADGTRVAFHSRADNLVERDGNALTDAFLHDLRTGITLRISVASDGAEGQDSSTRPALSLDGQRIAFQSVADNFAAPDRNRTWDVFFRDLAP